MEANRQPTPPEDESPIIILEFEAGDMVMTWANTKLRFYRNPAYDHIEFTNDDDEVVGLIAEPEFKDMLFERNFPARYEPVVEPETIEWFIRIASADLPTLEPESFK